MDQGASPTRRRTTFLVHEFARLPALGSKGFLIHSVDGGTADARLRNFDQGAAPIDLGIANLDITFFSVTPNPSRTSAHLLVSATDGVQDFAREVSLGVFGDDDLDQLNAAPPPLHPLAASPRTPTIRSAGKPRLGRGVRP